MLKMLWCAQKPWYTYLKGSCPIIASYLVIIMHHSVCVFFSIFLFFIFVLEMFISGACACVFVF